jgi:hypothetical protein
MTRTILLAEDDPQHVDLFCRAVDAAELDCHVEVLSDGPAVIDFLFATGQYKHRKGLELPELMFLDLKLPGMSGLQVLQMLRRSLGEEQARLLPVIVLTCSDDEEDVGKAYRFGAQSYINKPTDYGQFVDEIRQTLHYWLVVNRRAAKGGERSSRWRELPR